jgi:DNA-binding CsgD family transcriptional regulator
VAEENEPLSERELEILQLVATGAANKEIARRLVISPNTVKVHLRNIFTKIGVASRTEATLYAVKTGLVKPDIDQEASAELDGGEKPADLASLPAAMLPYDAIQTGKPTQRKKILRWALIILSTVLLFALALTGAQLLRPALVAPTVVSESTAQVAATQQRWTAKARLPAPRKGMGVAAYDNVFYLIGGETSSGIDGVMLLYDPTTDEWKQLNSKHAPVSDVQAVLLGEKIYIPGGRTASGAASSVLEVYDPRNDQWESKARLPKALYGYALAAFEGQLYLFGGSDGQQVLSNVYVYRPQDDAWEEMTAMSAPRAFASAMVVGNRIHILGGFDGEQPLDLNEAYFPTRDLNKDPAWESFAALPSARYAMGSAQIAGLIFLLGGTGENEATASPASLQYLAQADQWYVFDDPPNPVGKYPAVQPFGNFLFVLGGETPAGLSTAHQSYQAIYTISVPILRSDE